MDALCKQHAALEAKAGQRQKEIDSTHEGLEQLTEALNATAQGITKASADVDAMGPIAGEVSAIKALQDELKVCVELSFLSCSLLWAWGCCMQVSTNVCLYRHVSLKELLFTFPVWVFLSCLVWYNQSLC